MLLISVWVIIAVLAPAIANDKALFEIDENGWSFPFLSTEVNQSINTQFKIVAPIPYSAENLDLENANFKGPFDKQKVQSTYYRHWLGTDQLGRDVLANLIHGSRTALLVGLLSMFIAGFIGIILGFSAAFFGDNQLRIKRHKLIINSFLFIGFLIAIAYLIPWEVESVNYGNKLFILLIFCFLFIGLYYLLVFFVRQLTKNKVSKKTFIPVDLIIGRLIEIMEATPLLFLVVALASIMEASLNSIILIIGLTGWVSIAKYARAEVLKIKNLDYVESGWALGYSNFRILFKHILPNALTPILTALSFGVAAAILIEASLSFIGLGISASEPSWGSLLAAARSNYEAWWLAIFPGLAIFLTVLSCNSIGENYNR